MKHKVLKSCLQSKTLTEVGQTSINQYMPEEKKTFSVISMTNSSSAHVLVDQCHESGNMYSDAEIK